MPMRLIGYVFSISVVAMMACGSHGLRAEETGGPKTIHASGYHELKIAPQRLRLKLIARAEGSDAKSAIKALSEHKRRVKEELLALKAEEASIELGATQLTSTVAGVPVEMQEYGARVLRQMRSSTNGNVPNMPTFYQATSSVEVEWVLPTTDLDALALLPETLKEQVKGRDLVGEKNRTQLDDTQQEQLEEFQATMQEEMGYYSSDDSEQSSVTVLFIAKVDDETRQQALKNAYDQAVREAETLAAATSRKLGDLVSIRCSESPSDSFSAYTDEYGSYNSVASQLGAGPSRDEITNPRPDELRLRVRVEVDFKME